MPFVKQTPPPCAEAASDAETKNEGIAELAEAELHRGPYLALRNVTCAWREGTLILYGHLPTYHLKQMAQSAVATLPGVKCIDNRIDVISPCH